MDHESLWVLGWEDRKAEKIREPRENKESPGSSSISENSGEEYVLFRNARNVHNLG